MPLSPGDKLGQFDVLSLLGKGGMGEVYRARDTQLKREVALKVLPAVFSSDPDRLGRFQREAELLASLDHPNIGHIHGIVQSAQNWALVLALIEGPTLADRITQGPLPPDEAIAISKQIIDALEYAHEHGVIHRDLKPANIKITPDGVVKVLDFGLAKALDQRAATSLDPENSPTLTMGATQAGVIMGTAAYMSPEQAVGKAADRRSDIFSFGVVLYEMLTGKRPFHGESMGDTLAAVVKDTPDWSALPAETPSYLRKLLERMLAKDRKERLQAIGEARIILSKPPIDEPSAAPVDALTPSRLRWLWPGAAALLVLSLGVLAFVHFRETPPAAEMTRFEIGPPPGGGFTNFLSISPDGRKIAFTARAPSDPSARLWVRSLDTLEAKPLTPTSTNPYPFWSPDSRFIGYQVDGKLKKIDIAGGPPVTLGDADANFRGGTWSVDKDGVGTIVFGFTNGALKRISDQGGDATEITKLDGERQEAGHLFPSVLPDGRNFLYLRRSSDPGKSGIYLGSLDSTVEEQASRRLLAAEVGAAYAATPQSTLGHVLFMRESTLFSQPFDEGKLALTGEAVPVAEAVTVNERGYFSASGNGALIYRRGAVAANRQLTWYDRQGKMLGTVGDPANYNDTVRLSPDGTRVAAANFDTTTRGGDIWLVELARGVASRFTFDPANDMSPVWSNDGSHIAFRSDRGGHFDLYQKLANGAGEEELLFKSELEKVPTGWSPDGRFLLFHSLDPKTQEDVWVLPVSGAPEEKKPTPFVNAPYNEGFGVFSPDRKWIAYETQATSRTEIYVRPFSPPGGASPPAEGQWQVSKDGGRFPHWSADGKEIFFLSRGDLMTAEVNTAGGFRVGTPQRLFPMPAGPTEGWDVTADGKKFLISTVADAAGGDRPTITVVLNWPAMLKK